MPRTYPRPHFNREESWRYKRVKQPWRAPHGKTSRVRRSKDGWPPVVKIGYSRPRKIRGIHPSGMWEVLVWRPADLEKVDPKTQVARIAHTVGENKRVLILDEAKKAGIRVLNPRLKRRAEAAPIAPEPEPETAETATEGKKEAAEAPTAKPKKRRTTKAKKTKKKASSK